VWFQDGAACGFELFVEAGVEAAEQEVESMEKEG